MFRTARDLNSVQYLKGEDCVVYLANAGEWDAAMLAPLEGNRVERPPCLRGLRAFLVSFWYRFECNFRICQNEFFLKLADLIIVGYFGTDISGKKNSSAHCGKQVHPLGALIDY